MLFCFLKFRKKKQKKTPKFLKTKNRRIMLLLKCKMCDGKKSKYIIAQEASGLLNSLGIKTPLIKIYLVGHLLL